MEYILLVIALIPVIYYGSRLFAPVRRFPTDAQKNAELIKVLFDLDERPLAELFELYKKEFGPGAARYARETYRKWKAGQVRPSLCELQ